MCLSTTKFSDEKKESGFLGDVSKLLSEMSHKSLPRKLEENRYVGCSFETLVRVCRLLVVFSLNPFHVPFSSTWFTFTCSLTLFSSSWSSNSSSCSSLPCSFSPPLFSAYASLNNFAVSSWCLVALVTSKWYGIGSAPIFRIHLKLASAVLQCVS